MTVPVHGCPGRLRSNGRSKAGGDQTRSTSVPRLAAFRCGCSVEEAGLRLVKLTHFDRMARALACRLERPLRRQTCLIEQSDGTDRAAGAAPDLEREADEPEAALADEPIQIAEPLHVGEAEVAADVVHLEVVAP